MSNLQRRGFLQRTAAGMSLLASTRLWAGEESLPRTLVVLLRGAYDANNLLVPYGSDFYYQARPVIAIARPGTAENAAVKLDGQWGLAPSTAEALLPLWRSRQLAFVPFAGGEDTSRSHFLSQDIFEMGRARPAGGQADGFLNRLAAEIGASSAAGREALAFSDRPPLIFQGPMRVGNQGLRRLGQAAVDERQSELIKRMYAGSGQAAAVNEGFATRAEVAREMAAPMMDQAGRQAVDTKGFEGEARRIGRLMKDQVVLGFVDVGGWDTHAAQGGAEGNLSNRLAELSRGLAAMADEMGPVAWGRTVVVVASEFGRTFRENGNRGTDHGHGTTYWVLGGGVKGGRVAGRQQNFQPDNLFQNRDTPVLNEGRAVIGGLLAKHYGLSKAAMQRVFPGVEPSDLDLV